MSLFHVKLSSLQRRAFSFQSASAPYPLFICFVLAAYLLTPNQWLHKRLCMNGCGASVSGSRFSFWWTSSRSFSMSGRKSVVNSWRILQSTTKFHNLPCLRLFFKMRVSLAVWQYGIHKHKWETWPITNGSCCILLIDYNTMLCSTACSFINASLRRAG